MVGLLKLHMGALYVYKVDGVWRALADIDHVYHKCQRGLIDNVRRLVGIFNGLTEMGYKVWVVGKDYDDALHALVEGRGGGSKAEFDGLVVDVSVSDEVDIGYFERMHSYMDRVGTDVIGAALSGI